MCSFIRISRKFLLLYLFAVVLFSCTEKSVMRDNCELIAHAAGGIDGYIYTNSSQAFEQSVANGYRFIEVDLQLTSDSVLVAAYSWQKFNEITGYEAKGDTVPHSREFMSRLIYGKYTPLTAKDINEIMHRNSDVFLVTDKISDATILEKNFPTLKKRIVVEAFSYSDYTDLLDRGFYRVLYSCMAEDVGLSVIKHKLLHVLFPGVEIEWFALHTDAFVHPLFKLVDALCDYKAAVFTVNSLDIIPDEVRGKVKMIYTDSLLPCYSSP